MSEATLNQFTFTTLVEIDELFNISSEPLTMTVYDAPKYDLALHNQSISSNFAGNVSVGEEVVLMLTIDFPNGTEDLVATFDLTDEDGNFLIRPGTVETLNKGDNLYVSSPVAGRVTENRFVDFR